MRTTVQAEPDIWTCGQLHLWLLQKGIKSIPLSARAILKRGQEGGRHVQMDGMHRWPQLDALSMGLHSESIADPSDSSNLTQSTTPRNFCYSPDNEKRVEVTLNQSRPATNVRPFLGSGSGQWTVDSVQWGKESGGGPRRWWHQGGSGSPVHVPLAHRLWAHSFHLAAHDLFMIITSFA